MVLADFGADVVKIERPGGDPLRRLAAAPMGLRGKRSVVLDLHTDEGRKQLGRLAEGADAVVASFRPGRAPALGADERTDAILDELGYDAAAITKLHGERVVFSEPVVDPRAVPARS